MDKLKSVYIEFYQISKEYLERETCEQTSELNIDSDITTLMNMIPILEKKVCAITSEITDEQIITMMKYCNYKLFSFWFLKSGAVVKSVYNKLSEKDKINFKNIFKNILLNIQTLISLNNMYSNLKQDTADIVSDSRKIIEIVNHIKNAKCDSSAYQLLQNNYSFIIKTVNKILSDENYLLKMIAVFDSNLITDKNKLNEYREIFTISSESVIYGIRCVSDLDISSVNVENNKYTSFFKKVLTNVILFQNNDLNAQKFINIVSKLYVLIYTQLTSNPLMAQLLNDVLESVKSKVSIDDIKQRGINNIQTLIKFISENRISYKSIIAEEYSKREDIIIELLQNIINENNIVYHNESVNVKKLIELTKERFCISV
ncbi:Virion morphogenesis core protein [Eptesipox virus]|uniref:Virion morphogenesis core protein n=1 Tax=Eptesipox virus TaxID=1329402 RepID=A0A220T6G8_9POXV|nr:Virion morphogenesis core protein [Eptesipox virus]ASK51303.1 Virion morphogenesis core protein [Eptesipox virus]WAH71061.1 virion morphogenesis core protein [Eptesipox virus]